MFSADIAVGSFVLDVVDVLQNKRIKNYYKHIDAIVFQYVTHDEIDAIGRDWKSRKLTKHIKRVLFEAVSAYKKRQYATTAIVLWGDCYKPEQVIDGIPGRHAIAHGWLMMKKYPSRKEALNAILFTHYLVSLYDYEDDVSI